MRFWKIFCIRRIQPLETRFTIDERMNSVRWDQNNVNCQPMMRMPQSVFVRSVYMRLAEVNETILSLFTSSLILKQYHKHTKHRDRKDGKPADSQGGRQEEHEVTNERIESNTIRRRENITINEWKSFGTTEMVQHGSPASQPHHPNTHQAAAIIIIIITSYPITIIYNHPHCEACAEKRRNIKLVLNKKKLA